MRKTFLAGCFCLVLAGCGDDANRLYGSMSQVYPLDFDRVQAIRIDDSVATVSIEYVRLSGQGTVLGKSAKLTVAIGDIEPVAGKELDLTEEVAGLPRGSIQRVELSGTTDFAMKLGKVRFDGEPVAGASVSGWFRTTLGGGTADGRTLNGDFSTRVEAPAL
jgi:hypothetical protein